MVVEIVQRRRSSNRSAVRLAVMRRVAYITKDGGEQRLYNDISGSGVEMG